MIYRSKFNMLFACILIFGFNHLGTQTLNKSPLLTTKLQITGDVSIIIGKHGPVISPYFRVTRLSNPVSGLTITFEGIKLRETMPGQYAGVSITHIRPERGNKVRFSIKTKKSPLTSGGSISKKHIIAEGEATIGSMAEITMPVTGSVIIPDGRFVTVQWEDGIPSFSMGLIKDNPGSPLEVFSRSHIMGWSCSLRSNLFEPVQDYSVVVSYGMGKFKFKKSRIKTGYIIGKTSEVILRYTVISYVKTGKYLPSGPKIKK